MEQLSPLLKEIIGSAHWERNTIGMSGAGVYKLTGMKGMGNAYLKTARLGGIEPLRQEMEKLRWLADKAPVPEVLHFEIHDGYEYLLLSEIPGENLKESHWAADHPREIGKRIAKGLKMIHQININSCPFYETLSVKLHKAMRRIQAGLVDPHDFEPKYRGETAEQLYSILEHHQPKEDTFVFTHGDFSLANMIISGNQLTGYVDWGRSGVCDRHQDIGIAIRSLRHHFTDAAVDSFIDTYGENHIDSEKVAYYILLDELF